LAENSTAMPAKNWFRPISILMLLFVFCNLANAQAKKKRIIHHRQKIDTSAMDLNSRLSDSILQEAEIKDTTVPFMVNRIESYSFSLNRAENFLDRNFDTTGIIKTISGLERGLNYFHARLERNDNPLNLRNLNTSMVLLNESKETLEDWNKSLSAYVGELNNIHQRIREVKHDSSLLNDSLDALLHGQMKAIHDRSLSLDSILHTTTIKVNTLRDRVSINYLVIQDLETEIHDRQQAISEAMWKQEEVPLLDLRTADYEVTLWEILQDCLGRSTRVVKRFMSTTWNTRSINTGIWILLVTWFIVISRKVQKKSNKDAITSNLVFLKKSAVLSALLLLVTYGPFLYPSAPAVYVHMNEFFRLILLTTLLFPYLTKYGKTIWFAFSAIWIVFSIDDLLLDSAFGERWCLMVVGFFLMMLCTLLLWKKIVLFKNLEDSKARKWVLAITLAQIIFSIACNLTGRLTLSKLLAFSSIDSLVLALTLKVCCTILIDAVYTQSEVFQNRFFAFLNFVHLKNKLRNILWVVAIVVWVLSLAKDLMIYDRISQIIFYFINKPRSIGSITFSYANGILFVLIIWISSVLSQFVNFFFDETHNPGPHKKSRLGSVALIVRIGIWAGGFLIAVAAVGIPLDKISILIGALGVGIGFGLQNLVNNLVSGIIIAFERPIQIGDTIEVGGKTGTVQEIGVRSSQIYNGEGANIIVPNGDLLSQQLINWTLYNRNKQVRIMISVSYKSDFRKARDLIIGEIKQNEKIMKDPQPTVTVDSFSENSINLEIRFWVADMSDISFLRNELMMDIIESFSKNEIQIS
jgi:potassium-dependent mechanosensitive channel